MNREDFLNYSDENINAKTRIYKHWSDKTKALLNEQANKFWDLYNKRTPAVLYDDYIENGELNLKQGMSIHGVRGSLLWKERTDALSVAKSISESGLLAKNVVREEGSMSFNDDETIGVVDVYEYTSDTKYNESSTKNLKFGEMMGYSKKGNLYFPEQNINDFNDTVLFDRNITLESFAHNETDIDLHEKFRAENLGLMDDEDENYTYIPKHTEQALTHIALVIDSRTDEFKEYVGKNGELFSSDEAIKNDLVGSLLQNEQGGWDVNELEHKAYAYGIPNCFITGVILPWPLLYMDDINKIYFEMFCNKYLFTADGKLIFDPLKCQNMSFEEQYNLFRHNKENEIARALEENQNNVYMNTDEFDQTQNIVSEQYISSQIPYGLEQTADPLTQRNTGGERYK